MAKVIEKRVSDSRCYRTTTYYLFGKRVRRTQEYKGGKAPRGGPYTDGQSFTVKHSDGDGAA